MPIKRSSIKDVRRTKRRRTRNVDVMSRLRTQVTKARGAADLETASKETKAAESLLDKAALKGYIKANTASRTKKRLALALNKIKAAA